MTLLHTDRNKVDWTTDWPSIGGVPQIHTCVTEAPGYENIAQSYASGGSGFYVHS